MRTFSPKHKTERNRPSSWLSRGTRQRFVGGQRSDAATAVFIGRFQPFHAGHKDAFDRIVAKHGGAKILVGSSNVSRTEDNPLTFSERKSYLHAVLGEDVPILPLPDVPDDDAWLIKLRRHLRPLSIVYSGNDWVLDLCRRARIPCERVLIRTNISATNIRNMIRVGEDASHLLAQPLLPAKLVQIICHTNGVPKKRLGQQS